MSSWAVVFFQEWIDLLWVFLAASIVAPRHRLKAVCFVLACIFTLRLQVEFLMLSGYETGILRVLDGTLLQRGFLAYAPFLAFFLIISYFSSKSSISVYLAASISIYFIAFAFTSLILIL